MADVLLAQRAEHGVADGVHQRVRVRMAVEAFRVRNLHAAEDELAPGDQLMNVIADANVNHAPQDKFFTTESEGKLPAPHHKNFYSENRLTGTPKMASAFVLHIEKITTESARIMRLAGLNIKPDDRH